MSHYILQPTFHDSMIAIDDFFLGVGVAPAGPSIVSTYKYSFVIHIGDMLTTGLLTTGLLTTGHGLVFRTTST